MLFFKTFVEKENNHHKIHDVLELKLITKIHQRYRDGINPYGGFGTCGKKDPAD